MATLLLTAITTQGAGFALYEMSARGNAMGGALVGDTDDASAVYYNPANMVELPGVQTMAGVTLAAPTTTQQLPGGRYTTDERTFALPHAYATWQINDRWWLGLAEFSRFGLGTRYDPNWPGRQNNIETDIQTASINPNLAYKISDTLSAAAGFEAMYLNMKMIKSMLPATMPPFGTLPCVPLSIKGDAWGYGGDFALSWQPTEQIGIGLVYRLPVREKVQADADTGGIGAPFGIPAQNIDAEGTLVMPASTTLGLNYKPTERLNLGTDVTYTEWSSYDALNIDFSPNIKGPGGVPQPDPSYPKNWHDVWRFGFGCEYKLTQALAVESSYIYDMDPISHAHADYILPPGNRHIIGLGLGYTMGAWTINTGYSLLLIDTVSFTSTSAGTLPTKSEDSLAHLLACSVGRKF